MGARPFDKAIRRIAGKQYGAFSARQGLKAGGSEYMLQRRLDRGDIERVADGVYVLPGAPRCWRQRLWIALLEAGEGCVIAGRAAPALYGLAGYSEQPIDVLALHGRKNHRLTAGKLRETRTLPSHHVRRIDGIPVVSIERALFIQAASETFKRVERAVDSALTARLTTPERLWRTWGELAGRGRPGTRTMRVDLGAEGWIGRVDCYFRPRIIVELDGRVGHVSELDRAKDRQRINELTAAGFVVLQFTWTDLVMRPQWVLSVLRGALTAAA
jgi:hypothetical protein